MTIKDIIQSLEKRVAELQQEYSELEAKLKQWESNDSIQKAMLQEKDERIAQLESLIDDVNREKRSIESELENLRGY